MAKRNSGEVGFGRLSFADGEGSYEYISNKLPDRKELLEAYFGERFIAKFDELRPLGPDIGMAMKKQSDTSDLDYLIDCPVADYLELAEMTPLSEPWGRETLETGFAHVYEFGLFVSQKIIHAKSTKYGPALSKRTILLLYATHSNFNAAPPLLDLMRSSLQHRGNPFAAVFYVDLLADDGVVLEQLTPYGKRMPTPVHYRSATQQLMNMNGMKITSTPDGVVMETGQVRLGRKD